MARTERRADGSLVVTESGRAPLVMMLVGAGLAVFLLVATRQGTTDGGNPSVAMVGGGLALTSPKSPSRGNRPRTSSRSRASAS